MRFADPDNPRFRRVAGFAGELAVGAAAAGFLLTYAAVVVLRIRYRYELEWIEGLMVDTVRRVLDGLPIYVRPSLAFIPAAYPPLYYHVSAAVCRLFGLGFFPLRLVSALASLGCFGVIFEIVRRETRRPLWGLVAAGLFAATYRACGTWLDLARVDSLFLFLLLVAVALIRFGDSPEAGVAAGLLAAASFFTKQTALTVIGPLLCWAVYSRRRRAIPFVAAFGVATITAGLWLDHASAGWFWHYCFAVPSQHPLTGHSPGAFWTDFILSQTPILAGAAALFVVFRWRQGRVEEASFYFAALAGAAIGSWLSYMKACCYENVLLPTAAVLAIVGAMALAEAMTIGGDNSSRRRIGGGAAAGALCLAQFFLLRFEPAALLPGRGDAAAGDRMMQIVKAFPRDVLVVGHAFVSTRVGKPDHANAETWLEVFLARDETLKQELDAAMFQAVKERRFDAIVLDALEYRYTAAIFQRYRYAGRIFSGEEFLPVAGLKTRPDFLFVRNDLPAPAAREGGAP